MRREKKRRRRKKKNKSLSRQSRRKFVGKRRENEKGVEIEG